MNTNRRDESILPVCIFHHEKLMVNTKYSHLGILLDKGAGSLYTCMLLS